MRIYLLGSLLVCSLFVEIGQVSANSNDLDHNNLYVNLFATERLMNDISGTEGLVMITESDIKIRAYQVIMARWKKKQEAKWLALPQGDFTVNASAYTAAADECGKSDGVTSSGVKVQENQTIACPPQYPFGATIQIDGMGTYTCEDRGGAIKGNHIDIYMETKSEAFAFGRRDLTARVIQ